MVSCGCDCGGERTSVLRKDVLPLIAALRAALSDVTCETSGFCVVYAVNHKLFAGISWLS